MERAQCAVRVLHEEVAAWVVLHPGVATGAGELIAHCRERLAAFKYPRRVTVVAVSMT